MTPKLRVLIPSASAYPPTQLCPVNSTTPTPLKTPGFQGHIWVFVKGYNGDGVDGDGAEYFDKRTGMTYGIVVKGRFLNPVNADQVLFGNVFENPIRDSLPWGTSIATKFMYFIDPTLELDIYADKPWALSPALAAMSYLSLSGREDQDDFKEGLIPENTTDYLTEKGASDTYMQSAKGSNEKTQVAARRKWLGSKENREKITLDKETEVGFEFCNGLLDFNTLSATLPPPFHLSVPLLKYWDGQPVTYVCQRRPAPAAEAGAGSSPVGAEVFWSVAFEIVDEDAVRELEKKGKKVVRPGEEAGAAPSASAAAAPDKDDGANEGSEDVD